MRILATTILLCAAAFSTVAPAKDHRVKPHMAPASVEQPAAYDFNGYSAQGAYGLRPQLDLRPTGGDQFSPGVANGS